MSSHDADMDQNPEDEGDVMLDPNEAGEEIEEDQDHPMDSDAEDDEPIQEILLQNDSAAHFDSHKDSIFCIAQHPVHPNIIATGGGDDVAFVFDSTPADTSNRVLPASWESNPQPTPQERAAISPLQKLEGHTDSVNAIAFTLPRGEHLVTAGLDGRLRVYSDSSQGAGTSWTFLAEAQEVEEINFLAACPHPSYPNTIALGASDGSVWVYNINAADQASPLTILQAFYLHTAPATAGTWTPDGKLLATVSEDSSFYAWDVFGEAAAAGITSAESGSQAVVGLTAADQRFEVEGGLYSVAISPGGAIAAVGGAGGLIRIVGLPRLSAAASSSSSTTTSARGAGAQSKVGGGRKAGAKAAAGGEASAGQSGQILASLQAQSDGVETLSFSSPPLTLLAAGSVDGSVALFDAAHRFAVRRHIKEAHEEYAVVKVEFVRASQPGAASSTGNEWLLTTCGLDGVVRRWDARGGTAATAQGLLGEWRGHRGEGEGGGVLGFVQTPGGERVVTAGDDGISLVFKTST